MIGPILTVILALALLGVLPRWSHSRDITQREELESFFSLW